MIQSILKPGDKIEMRRLAAVAKPGGDERVYVSQLLEFVDDHNVHIAVPLESGNMVPLEIGGRFEMRFVTVNGIFVCKAEVSNRYRRGGLYYLAMKIFSDLVKDQRRQFFRLEKISPLRYHKLIDEEKRLLIKLATNQYSSDVERRNLLIRLKTVEPEEIDGTMANISGGGMKFFSKGELTKGDFIRINMYLDEADAAPLDLFAKVIFSEDGYDKGLDNEHRVEFINMTRELREKIVKYVFDEERRQRQKENGGTRSTR